MDGGRVAPGLLTRAWLFAFPQPCLSCMICLGPEGFEPLCDECAAGMHPIAPERCCGHCGAPDRAPIPGAAPRCESCRKLPDGFDGACSAFPYRGPAGAVLRRLKFQQARPAAKWAIEWSWPVLEPFARERARPELIVPIPLAPLREWSRGSNQSELLALAAGRRLGVPVDGDALARTRATPSQARMKSHAARVENMAGAFRVTRPREVAGRRVLLIDDVMTTGATVTSAALALQSAGASAVHVFTVARGGVDAAGEFDDV